MVENLLLAVVVIAIVWVGLRAARRERGAQAAAAPGAAPGDRSEALFASMFPELQPHFHPERLVSYVAARIGRTPARGGFTWKQPPGFGEHAVDIRYVKGREECALVDAAGAVAGRFRYEEHPQGGVLRVGEGKLTVDLREAHNPAVRYWHPAREFKWTRRDGWRFTTPIAERSIDSSDRGTSWSDSSPSEGARAVAAATAVAGLGGTFDGGGASAGWDAPADSAAPAEDSPGGGSSVAASDTDSAGDAGATSY